MTVPTDPMYQELGQLLTTRLKTRCHPLVSAALDQCWISLWHYPDMWSQGEEGDLTPRQVLVLSSTSAIAVTCLQKNWRAVAMIWRDLTGSLTHLALFQIVKDQGPATLEAVLFEAVELVET